MAQNVDCQFKVLERVYNVNFDELVKKIQDGNVLRHDPVKIGSTVWTAAEKIPELAQVFKETDLTNALPDNIDLRNVFTHFQAGKTDYGSIQQTETSNAKVCAVHADKSPYYICTICENLFCRDCPARNSEKSRICPFCGGNCDLYMGRVWKLEKKKAQANYEFEEEAPTPQTINYQVVYTKLRFKDFIDALIYPLRFPLALMVGGVLFSVLVFGQIVTLFKGGGFLFVALVISAVILMLKFSILTKCFENLSQKDPQRKSYMWHIEKFGVVEDFVVPFMTGLRLYLVSFGLFFILALTAGFYAWVGFSGNLEKLDAEVLQTEQHVNSIINNGKSDLKPEQKRENELRIIRDNLRLQQIESVFGTNHLADNEQLQKLIGSMMRLTIWFQMPICFAFIFGVLFFPAVCLSAGENHFFSIKNTIFSGIKMIKVIGFDYLKVLFMCFVFLQLSVVNIFTLNWLFLKLEMPAIGVFSAIVAGSFLIYYFWV